MSLENCGRDHLSTISTLKQSIDTNSLLNESTKNWALPSAPDEREMAIALLIVVSPERISEGLRLPRRFLGSTSDLQDGVFFTGSVSTTTGEPAGCEDRSDEHLSGRPPEKALSPRS